MFGKGIPVNKPFVRRWEEEGFQIPSALLEVVNIRIYRGNDDTGPGLGACLIGVKLAGSVFVFVGNDDNIEGWIGGA